MGNKALRIKEICDEQGITLAELSQKLNYNQATSFYQALGRNNFSIDKLANIATALGVEIPELFASYNKLQKEDVESAELTALIYHNGSHYRATTIAELEEVVSRIKERE